MTFKAEQLDLFPRDKPEKLMAFLAGKLPGTDLIGVSDVAGACNVSVHLVYGWIDEGMVQAVNFGSTKRPYWRVYRRSVLALMQSRLAGSEMVMEQAESGKQKAERGAR